MITFFEDKKIAEIIKKGNEKIYYSFSKNKYYLK